jgi:uncharacterized protein
MFSFLVGFAGSARDVNRPTRAANGLEAAVKVRLEDIPPEGLTVEQTDTRLRPRDLGPQVGVVLSTPWARWQLKLLGERVQAKAEYHASLGLVCSRCLRETPLDVSGELDLVFRPQKSVIVGEEVQVGEDELEIAFYQGGEVDLDQVRLDELSLSLPLAPLCRAQCPGFCQACGKHLGEGPCGCRPKQTDSRWAKLAKLEIK